MSIERPSCLAAVGSVRASRMPKSARWANVVQTFWPSSDQPPGTRQRRGSGRRRCRTPRRVRRTADTTPPRPARMRGTCRHRCASVPNSNNVGRQFPRVMDSGSVGSGKRRPPPATPSRRQPAGRVRRTPGARSARRAPRRGGPAGTRAPDRGRGRRGGRQPTRLVDRAWHGRRGSGGRAHGTGRGPHPCAVALLASMPTASRRSVRVNRGVGPTTRGRHIVAHSRGATCSVPHWGPWALVGTTVGRANCRHDDRSIGDDGALRGRVLRAVARRAGRSIGRGGRHPSGHLPDQLRR